MKKSHLITYGVALVLMIVSYVLYLTVYLNSSPTFYNHSFHLFGIVLVFVPLLFELIFKKDLPLGIIIAYYVFVFMSQIWGSAYHGYNRVPFLDSVCHGFSAILIAVFFAYISNEFLTGKPIFYQVVYLVGATVLVGVLWEIVEFCGDSWFGMNNQVYRGDNGLLIGQEALKDTMEDLICDLCGGVVGTISYVLCDRFRVKGK